MNSDYTQFNDYYKNQNNYIPTRYYCEAFASAEIAYFDISSSSDERNIIIDASQISNTGTITGDKFSKIVFNADKIQGDIKSFNVFTWNPSSSSYTPAVAALSTNPALFLSKPNNGSFFNTITIGRGSGASMQTALGAGNPKGAVNIARVYVTY